MTGAERFALELARLTLRLARGLAEPLDAVAAVRAHLQARLSEDALQDVLKRAQRLELEPTMLEAERAAFEAWFGAADASRVLLREDLDLEAFELSEADVKALDALEANANVTWDAPPGQHFDLTTLP